MFWNFYTTFFLELDIPWLLFAFAVWERTMSTFFSKWGKNVYVYFYFLFVHYKKLTIYKK